MSESASQPHPAPGFTRSLLAKWWQKELPSTSWSAGSVSYQLKNLILFCHSLIKNLQ